MTRTLLLSATLFLCACAQRPLWVEKGAPVEPGRFYAVSSGPLAEQDRLGERAKAELAARLAAPEPEPVAGIAADDRFGRFRASAAAPQRIPEPPAPLVTDTFADGDRVWVMARADAGPWLDVLHQRIAEIDRALDAAQAALPAEPEPGDALRCLRATTPLLAERDALAARIARVDPQRSPAAAAIDRTALERRLRAALDRATIELVSLDASAKTIVAAVGDALIKRGWKVVSRDGWARLSVTVVTSERTIDGLLRLDGILDGEMVFPGGGSAPLHLVDRGDGGDPLLARDRLGQRLGLGLSEELDRRLARTAENR